jgi:FixJ family two-component response regulator
MPGSPATKTVIIVDDEVNIVNLLVDILDSAGYRPIGCSVWTEAMDAINRESPDLVLLDLKMPTIDGPAMLDFIRKEGLDVPVIVVSGFVTDQVSEDLSKLGVSAFVSKPFRTAEILKQVEKALSESTPAPKTMDALYESTKTETSSSAAPTSSSDTGEVLAALQKLGGQGSGATKAPTPPHKSDSTPPGVQNEILAALQRHDSAGKSAQATAPPSKPAAAAPPIVPPTPQPRVTPSTPPTPPEPGLGNNLKGRSANTESTSPSESQGDESGRSVSVTGHRRHRPPPRRLKRLTKRNVPMFSSMFVICLVVAGFMAALNWFTAQIDIEELKASTEKAITKQATKEILQQLKDQRP